MAFCETCHNTGELDCLCGGDLCVCGLNTYPCPNCCEAWRDDEYEDEEDFYCPLSGPQKEESNAQ